MRPLALAVAVLSTGCAAQASGDPAPAPPALESRQAGEANARLEAEGSEDRRADLEALGLVGRARALAPFVGGTVREARAALGV